METKDYMRDHAINGCYYLLVVGSRDWENRSLLCRTIEETLERECNGQQPIIVHGGANGADRMAATYAADKEYDAISMPADWQRYGTRAGYIRNERMHKYISQFPHRSVLAFWDGRSHGTAHSIPLAEKYKNELVVVYPDGRKDFYRPYDENETLF